MLSNDIMLKLQQCKLANISLGRVIDEAALLPLAMWFLRSNSTSHRQCILLTEYFARSYYKPHECTVHCTFACFLLQCGFTT